MNRSASNPNVAREPCLMVMVGRSGLIMFLSLLKRINLVCVEDARTFGFTFDDYINKSSPWVY